MSYFLLEVDFQILIKFNLQQVNFTYKLCLCIIETDYFDWIKGNMSKNMVNSGGCYYSVNIRNFVVNVNPLGEAF